MSMNLFKPVVDMDKMHPYVRKMIEDPDPYAQEVILGWADNFIDRDGKFVQEFQTTFNSSFWELYLFACLKELGCDIDFSQSVPDFVAKKSIIQFCIEARISNNPIDQPSESDHQTKLDTLLDPNKQIDIERIFTIATARIKKAIREKHNKLRSSYVHFDHVKEKPFVLAIAPFEQPFFQFQGIEAIMRVLYDSTLTFSGYMRLKDTVPRIDSGTRVGFFTRADMPEISAVIFSNVATFGKVRALSKDPNLVIFRTLKYGRDLYQPVPAVVNKADYQETLLNGVHVFHNPYAQRPLDWSVFDYPYVIQHKFDINRGLPVSNYKEGALIVRNVVRLTSE